MVPIVGVILAVLAIGAVAELYFLFTRTVEPLQERVTKLEDDFQTLANPEDDGEDPTKKPQLLLG